MAVNYTSLFEDIGSFIAAVNVIGAVDIETLRDHVYTTLNANSTDNTVEQVKSVFDLAEDRVVQARQPIADKVTERLQDRTTVLEELGVYPGTSIEAILFEMIKDMPLQTPDPITIDQSVVTVPATATAAAGNVGTGQIHLTKQLDGYSQPHPGMPANIDYAGVDSELTVDDDLTFTCNSDSDANARPRGQEQFLVKGSAGWRTKWDWHNEGSGAEMQVATDNAFELLANGDFASWNDAGIPESWEVITGVAGTDFAQNADAINIVAGSYDLKLIGDTELQQVIPPQILTPNRLYRLSFWAVKSGTVNVDAVFDIISKSAEVSMPTGLEFSSMTTGLTFHTALVLMPANLADDMVIRLKFENSDTDFYVDRMSIAPVNYINGIGFNIIAGADDFSIDDRFTAAVSNAEKQVQQFFRRMYGIQLPSSATPEIPDSVADAP